MIYSRAHLRLRSKVADLLNEGSPTSLFRTISQLGDWGVGSTELGKGRTLVVFCIAGLHRRSA